MATLFLRRFRSWSAASLLSFEALAEEDARPKGVGTALL
jgi:hypothetical protein